VTLVVPAEQEAFVMVTRKYLPPLLFVLGFGLLTFTRRSEIIPFFGPAIILAPILILRFIRTQPPRRGVLLTLVGFILSMNLALLGLFEIHDALVAVLFGLARSTLLGILYWLPYMVDRLLYPRFREKGILSTLTFPILTTGIFFLASLEGPFDGDAVFAVFSYGTLEFRQLASLVGLWGFVFVFSWFASIVNFGLESGFEWRKLKTSTWVFMSIVLMILLFGEVKTSSLMDPISDTVTIAAVVLLPQDGRAVSLESVFRKKLTSPFVETMSRIESLSRKAASGGAEIVTFQEYAITVHEKDEEKLIAESGRIARQSGVYLSLTYGVFPGERKGENKQILISDRGEVEIAYVKRYLLGFGPFGETAVMSKGAEVIQSTQTPYGRLGVATCRDMSFPPYIRQAGEQKVDIMLGPSYDWPKSEGPSYDLRAIENGFSFVRPTFNGVSFAVDYNGKMLADMDSDETRTGIMYVQVPTRGVKTIYSTIGDLFAWLSVLGMIGLVGFVVVFRKS
jgi:apolipoprotein N-acyltransferase